MKALITALALSAVASFAHAADGKAIYNQSCAMCHQDGLMNAPKFGDKAAWEPRLKAGHAALLHTALNGKPNTPMIARGGNPKLTDEEVGAALDHMLGAVK
jgi:cytochrome c5